MSQNRTLGSPYEIMTMNPPAPSAPWGFTTNHETDLYLVNPDGLNPVTVALDPFAAPGDRVAIQDATGLSTTAYPIVIEASPGQSIALHSSGFVKIETNGISGAYQALLTMGEDNVWYAVFLGGP
jgi:hypothetical protein